MRTVLTRRDQIAEIARRLAPSKRYWAIVGNGPNKVAAEEVRIKLSELCYKSMACDSTEDKKHIDLSSEPLILVCAAASKARPPTTWPRKWPSSGPTRRRRSSSPTTARRGSRPTSRSVYPPSTLHSASCCRRWSGTCSATRRRWRSTRRRHPLREAREAVEHLVGLGLSGDEVVGRLNTELRLPAERFHDGLRSGTYDGHLEASTATRLSGLLRDVLSERPVEQFQDLSGKVGTPQALIDDLVAGLTKAIEELTRPIDTIKHQAKTVTVGISRSDEGIIDRPLVQAVLTAGAGRDVISYRTMKVLADLDPAVAEVHGYTRYGIEGTSISIVDRGGISRDLPSRVDRNSQLRGTKRRVASEREVLVAGGETTGARWCSSPRPRPVRPRGSRCCTCRSTTGCRPT